MDGPIGAINDGATIPDSSGNGNNGTMIGNAATYVAGQINQGIQLNGGNISIPNSPSLQVNQFTTSMWINGGTGWLYSNRYPTGGHDSYGTGMYYNGSQIGLNIGDVNGYWFSVNGIFANVARSAAGT